MSKELEAKDLQANFIKCFNELLTKTNKDIFVVNISREMAQDMVNLYEKYLTINPSEALNYLNQFINEMTECLENPKQYVKDYDNEIFYKYKYTFETTIKQALLKAQEMEKVLEIIKEKVMSLVSIEDGRVWDNELYGSNELTEEEFDLLKRWLENES